MNIVIGLGVGLVIFASTISAYCMGLKHGKSLSSGNVPKMEIPLISHANEAIKSYINKKESKEEIENIMGEYWR